MRTLLVVVALSVGCTAANPGQVVDVDAGDSSDGKLSLQPPDLLAAAADAATVGRVDGGAPDGDGNHPDLEPPPCGGEGAACCVNAVCNDGLTCDNLSGNCSACGYQNGPCCGGNTCAAGRACLYWPTEGGNVCTDCGGDVGCMGCGAPGQPCCLGNRCQPHHECQQGQSGSVCA